MLPLNWSKIIFLKGEYNGIGTYATSHNYPLIMSFSVEENAVFIYFTRIFKNSPYRGRGTPPPPPPPPRSLRSLGLGRFAPSHIIAPPLRLNPRYATVYRWRFPNILNPCPGTVCNIFMLYV